MEQASTPTTTDSPQTQAPVATEAVETQGATHEQKVQETSPQETQKQEVQVDKKEEDSFSSKFAALSRRERELVKKERLIKEREKQIEASGGDSEKLRKLVKEDPFKVLEILGTNYDELTQYALAGTSEEARALRQVKKELDELKKQKEEEHKTLQEREAQAKVDKFKAEQREHILKAGAKYELINATERYDLVYDVVDEYFRENQEILDNDTAAKMVEDYLEKEVEKVLKAEKIKNRFVTTKKEEPAEKPESKSFTLTNKMSQVSTEADNRPLSREESLERAASLIKFI